MATATILCDSARIKDVKYKHSAAVAAGDILLLSGRVLIALTAILISTAGMYAHAADIVEVPKTGTQVWTAGVTIYWDDTAKSFTTVATANTKCGIAYEDAASADVIGKIILDNSVNY